MATKEVRKLVKALREQGWRVEETRKGHFQAFAPSGVGIVTIPGTPSDHRAMRNVMADLRRFGYEEKR